MNIFKGDRSMNKIQQLSDYINQSQHIAAITGAGISVAGGGVTYGQMVFSNGLRRFGKSTKDYLPTYLDNMFSYNPSFSHYALADLEKEGKLIGIITTNVDCMHTIAGSKNVAEIQGSLQVNCCEHCGQHYDNYTIWKKDELPVCEKCGGQILPWPLYSGISLWQPDVQKARNWISKADLILAIGTHGYFSDCFWQYRRDDAIIVQINPGHTGFDSIADFNIKEECDKVFKQLQERYEKSD